MARFFPSGRAGAGLALVMLFELCLFVDFHYRRWEEVIAPLNQPVANQGEGLVIRGNGLGYYAWLRSLLIDHDWDFANEFDEHPVAGDYVPPATYKTDLDRRANQWSVGPACVWAIFVVPGHFVLQALGAWSPWAADGYSLPYQLLVAAASLTMSFLGLLFLYRICLQYARPSRAALSAILLTLGSTLIYYDTIEVSMAHGMGAAVLAGLVCYWLETYGSLRWSRWLAVGLLVGAAALMRWQLATFAVLPAGEVVLCAVRTRQDFGKRLAGLALAGVASLVAFVPQMWAWRCVYGHWLVEPIPQIAHHWLGPAVWDILLSQDRSLFYWTPICALAFLGHFLASPHRGRGAGGEGEEAAAPQPNRIAMDPEFPSSPPVLGGRGAGGEGGLDAAPLPSPHRGRGAGGEGEHDAPKRDPSAKTSTNFSSSEPTALLFAALGLQLYALASVWGKGEYLENVGNFAGAFLSKAYGMRHLTEAVVMLAPGLAVLLERSSKISFRLLCGLGFFLALWNLLLVSQYSEALLPEDVGIDPLTLLQGAYRYVKAEPLGALVPVEALGLICLVLLWGSEKSAIDSHEEKDPPNHALSRSAMLLRWGTLVLLMAALLASTFTPSASVGFLYRVYRDPDGRQVRYGLFVPHDYRADQAYPLLVYLHGSGVRNWDATRPPREPLAAAIREQEATFDMIAVFPQSVSGTWEPGSPDLDRAMRIVDEVGKSYHVDADRISLTGVSRGAFGVWTLAAAHPEKWAAIVPICGGGNPQDARKIQNIPCWCFHGQEDRVIPVEESRRMIGSLRKLGADPRYEEYPGVGHKCWDKAYRTAQMFQWLRGRKRS